MALATGGVICFNSYRSMTKDHSTAKEFDASCSCWIFPQKHQADTMLLLPVKCSALNSVITDISYELETNGKLMLTLERPEEHVYVLGSKMLQCEA